jgi:RNA-directed DNA polymerase
MSNIAYRLALETGLREADVRRIMISAPSRYKSYLIPKKSGGTRQISQPAREVKSLQRVFSAMFLDALPVHPCATAYMTGKSTLQNALPHASNGPILKLDFKNFFPSIRARDWISYCEQNALLPDDQDRILTAHLLFQRRKGSSVLELAIGAPTSPRLSNILMYKFDEIVSNCVAKDHVTYTRYADDLTFSAPRTGHLLYVKRDVAKAIRAIGFPKLDINNEKTTEVTKKYHRTVTGLTLANDGRVTIGRDRKREIRAAVHHAVSGLMSNEDLRKLAGTLAYVNSVEPGFLGVLRAKYTDLKISEIQRCVDIPVRDAWKTK